MTDYTERANEIAGDRADRVRYKVLTLKEVRKNGSWHDPGKDSGKRWNNGELMYAFEDGSVFFKEGGASFRERLKDPEEVARWIRFLDSQGETWH